MSVARAKSEKGVQEEFSRLKGGRDIRKDKTEKEAIGFAPENETMALTSWTDYPVLNFLCHCPSLWPKELKDDSKDNSATATYHSSLFPSFCSLLSFLSFKLGL